MNVIVSKHAIKRYKERILNKKRTSGAVCTRQIKKAIKKCKKIYPIKTQDTFIYDTGLFKAVVKRNKTHLFVITVFSYQDQCGGDYIEGTSMSSL